ncbi:MAG: hypothetical protein Q7S92_03765 [Candidatus Diapherotrites archaeon]|nr:hypothetical protein [Candidatus Diapherotrites archaeon]
MPKIRVLLLLSGGIDSPVAGFLAQQQNFEIIAVHFASKFIGRNPEDKCKDVCEKLTFSKLIVLNASPAFEELAKQCAHGLYFVLMKRFMLKTSEYLAEKENCSFLVTGESLGQVSSQTLANLSVIQSAIHIPLLRPVLALDKEEIIQIAKKIGTYEISIGPESCDILGSKHPNTQAILSVIESEEKKLDYKTLIQNCLTTSRKI